MISPKHGNNHNIVHVWGKYLLCNKVIKEQKVRILKQIYFVCDIIIFTVKR